MRSWLDERLDLSRLNKKLLHKSFPVHHSFFLGEINLLAFITLVLTGVFLSLYYEGSSQHVTLSGQSVPAAYASIVYIDSLPFGALLRSVHHWSAHVLVAGVVLHLLRVLLTGAYKNPREPNWLIGLALLGVTVMTSFVGYALSDDAYAVTATHIGYGIASAIPWVGSWIASVMFGGEYPTSYSLPRMLPVHILWLPLVLGLLLVLHLLIVIKQKHTQPRYARVVAPHKILGVPLVPQQALMMSALFFIYLAVLFVVAGIANPHPVQVFGPPTASTPSVKPDWYFLWIYGILELIPSSWTFTILGQTFGPEVIGGMMIPGVIVAAGVALPFVDRSSRKGRYLEAPLEHPARIGVTVWLLSFVATASMAGYHAELGLSVGLLQAALLIAPVAAGAVAFGLVRALAGGSSRASPPGRSITT